MIIVVSSSLISKLKAGVKVNTVVITLEFPPFRSVPRSLAIFEYYVYTLFLKRVLTWLF